MSRDEFAMREQSFSRNTESQLDDFIGQAQNLLENLTDQHGILKVRGIQDKEENGPLKLGFVCIRKHKRRFWIQQIIWDCPRM
jgi:hypothetical protein